MNEQHRQPHARWFGRSEDDPNRLLIIEDEQSKVFLDADMREELYSVIGHTHTSTTAKGPCKTCTDHTQCYVPCKNAPTDEQCRICSEAIKAEATEAVIEGYTRELKERICKSNLPSPCFDRLSMIIHDTVVSIRGH